MGMRSVHGTTNGSADTIWLAMLWGTSTKTDHDCTSCPLSMRSLRSQPLSSALRGKNKTREQHECTNLMHSDLAESNLACTAREQPCSGSLVLRQHPYGPLPIARDAPIVHFRSYAVSGMISLCNAEGRERES